MNQEQIDSILHLIKSYGVMFKVVDLEKQRVAKPYIISGYFKSYEATNEPYLKLIDEGTLKIAMSGNFHFKKPNKEELYQQALKAHKEKPKNIDSVVEHTYQSQLIRSKRREKDFTASFLTIINEKLKELSVLLKEVQYATA